jgi:phosphoribosyl-ATP pyrophosphohydrolase
MKVTRTANRRNKIDSVRDVADAGNALPVRTTNGTVNGRINVPPLRPGFNESGYSSERSVPSAVVLEQLYGALGQVTAVTHPRTFKLLQSGDRKLARKVIEEACEVTVEAVKRQADGMVRESADLLYHLVVLWRRFGIEPIEIWREMQTRADMLGIAEKLPKTPKPAPFNSSC